MVYYSTSRDQSRKWAIRGFSLVELMVGLTIGLLVLSALTALYLSVSRTNAELARNSVQIENGRFAINLLRDDLAQAGFWGTYLPKYDNLGFSGIPDDVPSEVPSPCLDYQTTSPAKLKWTTQEIKNLTGISIAVYSDIPNGCTTLISNRVTNTDILVIRHAEPCTVGDVNCDSFSVDNVYFQSSLDVDCSASGSYPSFLLEHRGTDNTRLRLKNRRNCSTAIPNPTSTAILAGDAPLRKYVSNIYWIRNYAVTVGDGIPTLMRSQFGVSSGSRQQLSGQPLVDGIEGFRVELGVDSLARNGGSIDYTAARVWADPDYQANPTNRGDGMVDGAYVRCTTACTVAQLMNTVAARVFVLARARDASSGYTDSKTYNLSSLTGGPTMSPGGSYRRQLFSTTVRLQNISDRRDTP